MGLLPKSRLLSRRAWTLGNGKSGVFMSLRGTPKAGRGNLKRFSSAFGKGPTLTLFAKPK